MDGSATFFFALVNGSPSKLFKIVPRPSAGGPSLLFSLTIVVEALSALLVKARGLGVIGGFEMGQSDEAITHLQFADDTIIFSSVRREEILAIKRTLWYF